MTSILDITEHIGPPKTKTAIREIGGRTVTYADLFRERYTTFK